MHAILFDLYREDAILCDTEMNRYTLDQKNQSTVENPTDYDLCSDRLLNKFPTYQFDDKCRIIPGPDTPLRNFRDLKALLLSKDLSLDADFEKTDLRFLDGKCGMKGNMVAFQSFPRCGNTFLRRFIEQITGVHTGADMNIQHTFHEAMMGLLG